MSATKIARSPFRESFEPGQRVFVAMYKAPLPWSPDTRGTLCEIFRQRPTHATLNADGYTRQICRGRVVAEILEGDDGCLDPGEVLCSVRLGD